jgi:hypothetical protein
MTRQAATPTIAPSCLEEVFDEQAPALLGLGVVRRRGARASVDLADGSRWRLEYKANGYFFVNTSSGFNGTGDWRAEDERLCSRLRGRETSCNEVRDVAGVLHLKRDSGEVIALRAR